MRKNLVSAIAATSMLLASSAALAETRPQAARFSQPLSGEKSDVVGFPLFGVLLGLGGLAGVVAAVAAASNSNSPKV